LYYGSDWQSNANYNSQTRYLDGFLNNVVTSSYMDMLNKAGYNVGAGSFSSGRIVPAVLNKSQPLTDAQLRIVLQSNIKQGTPPPPDSTRLYVVFVEDNVEVTTTIQGHLFSSKTDFAGYHWAFAGGAPPGVPADIRYAVIPYPGGSVGNSSFSFLSTLDG